MQDEKQVNRMQVSDQQPVDYRRERDFQAELLQVESSRVYQLTHMLADERVMHHETRAARNRLEDALQEVRRDRSTVKSALRDAVTMALRDARDRHSESAPSHEKKAFLNIQCKTCKLVRILTMAVERVYGPEPA